MHRLLTFLIGLSGALVGGAIVLAVVHAYYDHRALHDVINLINANAAKATAP